MKPPPENREKEVPVAAVKKAFDLLSILLFEDPEGEGIPLQELAAKLGMPSNSAFNTLKTMRFCGYVEQTPERRYIAGPNCRRIGASNYVDSDLFKNRLARVLADYSARIHEALVFAVLIDGHRNVVARSEAQSRAIRIDSRVVDQKQGFYSLATGRAMIALADPREYRQILRRNGDIFDAWPEYETDIPLIRKQGFCDHSTHKDIRAGAIAFRAASGALASIGFHAPLYRCADSQFPGIVAELRLAAAELANKFHKVE